MVVEVQERKEKKCTVLLDGEFFCCCYPKDLWVAGIADGELAEGNKIGQLCKEVFLPRAKRRALFLLNKKRYTRQEMMKKLTADGYPVVVIEETISYLEALHYVDDMSFAQGYATLFISKYSERELHQKMVQKGFEKEVIAEAIKEAKEAYFYENGDEGMPAEAPEQAAIRNILRKKGYCKEQLTAKQQKKLAMSLYRKGFSFSDIKKVMGEIDMAEQDATFF